MIFTRYLFREIFFTLSAITILLILIYLSHRFMGYLVKAAAGALPVEFIFKLLGLRLLSDITLLIPLAFFLAVLLALGRLYKDNEITALAACGIPVPVRSIGILAILTAICIAIFSLILSPWARHQEELLKTHITSNVEWGGITAGRFKEFKGGEGVFYAEKVDEVGKIMENIFVKVALKNKQVIVTAQTATQRITEGHLFMVANNGFRYEFLPNSLEMLTVQFQEHTLRLQPRLDDSSPATKREAIPTPLLWNAEELDQQAELQWRLSLPLSVILLGLLAIPLSYTTPRQGQYAKIFTGVLIYLIYNNLLNIAQKWVARGEVPLYIGVWWVHLILLGIILVWWHYGTLRRWWRYQVKFSK